jgi:beta-galactosidase
MTTELSPRSRAGARSRVVSGVQAHDRWDRFALGIPATTGIAFGGDYNPEQWPREVWSEDIALMLEAGVTLVSIGIFSWALIEPREGEFDFGWLDDVIEMLADAGIGVDLGTPTASPPPWFWARFPDARPMTRQGLSLGVGSRGMASPSSPEYAAATTRIVTALGERYGRNPAVKLWHVHNEYGAPVSECYSDHSVRAFRRWLQHRYGGLDALNDAWGTAFWGQRYGEWDEIDAPRISATTSNPSQRLDFARFSNFALLENFRRERDILHRLSPGVPVTTNFMATNCLAVDYWTWAGEVDIVANDHYLKAEREDSHILLSMDADLVRSLAGGRPWLLLEHSTSAVNWQPRNLAKGPGELARNSMQHFARGSDGIMFFQWRASRSGAEKFHSAMVPHGGAGTRVFRETVSLGAELAAVADARGSVVEARVAILWDWESFWAQDLEWRPSIDLDHRRQIETFYERLWLDGVTCDFAHPEADLSGYSLVLAPSLYLVTPEARQNLQDYVSGGGVFVASYFSGIVTGTDTVYAGDMPGGLHDLLGITIQEFGPLRADQRVELTGGLYGTVWTDDIQLTAATAEVSYVDGPMAGKPAITRNAFGSGTAWYLSTEFDPEQLRRVLAAPLAEAHIEVGSEALAGVERVVRRGDRATFTTVINHTGSAVHLDDLGVPLSVGVDEDPTVLPGGAVRVFRRDAE